MEEPEEEQKPVRKRNGCRGCLLTGVASVVLLILAGIILDWREQRLAEYSREQAIRLKSDDLDGIWEGKWSWEEGEIARLIVKGNTVTLQNFPVSLGGAPAIEAINSDRARLRFPFYNHGRYQATDLDTGSGNIETLFLKCPSKSELGLQYDCDVVYYYKIEFRRVGR